MKKIVNAKSVMIRGREFPLPASMKSQGHYFPILEKTVEQLDAMLSHHCKVMVLRLDLHLHDASDDNKVMSDFIKRLKQHLTRRASKGCHKRASLKRLGYVWCREQNKSNKAHYHSAFFVDASKYQKGHTIAQEAIRLWQERDVGLIHIPNQSYRIVRRGDESAYRKSFKRVSYLGKVYSKQLKDKTVNTYSTSRIKAKS